ncbi:MAG: CRTAC1 family protein [Flavobacteriales bacterium]|nr:CRTAC1 family protein [Flavobacteriales bacterium]
MSLNPSINFPAWVWLCCICACASATEVSAQWNPWPAAPDAEAYTNFSGQGMSFVDFNLDGWDDLTVSNASNALLFYAGGPEGLEAVDLGITPGTGRPIALMWLDIDNDGDRDFVHTAAMPFSLFSGGGLVSQSQVWICEDGGFVDRTAEWGFGVLEDRAANGMAWNDMDLDGDLDVMVSIYAMECQSLWLTENVLLEQDAGTLVDVSELSGVASGLQPSFQGTWLDLNADGRQDLFVINDAGIDPTCPVFNQAFINNGDGSFTESGAALGLEVSMSSMCAAVGDPDGDGAEEIFVTNQSLGEFYYPFTQLTGAYFDRNDAGIYEERSEEVGLDTDRWSWGSMWVDQDLDGWEDLLVATSPWSVSGADVETYDNYFFRHPGASLNNGDSFEDVTGAWWGKNALWQTAVRGDFDGDLRPDVVGAGGGQYATFLLNAAADDHPERHRLTVSVCGTHSNSEAIGTRMVLHSNGHAQQRLLRAGEDYFVQHSATQFFGLGTLETADSLEVFWPMGGRSCLYDIPADSAVSVIEGAEEVAVQFESVGDSVWLHLDVPPRWTSVVWNGDTLDTLSVLVPEGTPMAYEVLWFGGLFDLSGAVDWSGYGGVLGCTVPIADNYVPSATEDDGSCTYEGLCGPGTVWSVDLQQCVVQSASCAPDIDDSGAVDVADILLILGAFGQQCQD